MGSTSHSDSSSNGKERLRWTQELHDRFVEAVTRLGALIKYRISKFIPESTTRGKLQSRSISDILPNFSKISALQLKDILQMQMGVQKSLKDPLEVEKRLKPKIEAQRKYLESFEQSYQSQTITRKACKPLAATPPLPLLSEDSGSYSKVCDYFETQIEEEHRSAKKQRVDEGVLPMSIELIGPPSSELYNQGCNLSWNQLAPCQSHLVPNLL